MSTEKHVEETKMMIPAKDLTMSKDGHVTIKNPRIVEKLKAAKVGDGAREVDGVYVGVVVGTSF